MTNTPEDPFLSTPASSNPDASTPTSDGVPATPEVPDAPDAPGAPDAPTAPDAPEAPGIPPAPPAPEAPPTTEAAPAPPAPVAPLAPGVLAPAAPPVYASPTAPGVLATGAATLAPPAPGTGYVPPKPTGLQWGAIVATGLYAFLAAYGALTASAMVDDLKEQFADPENVTSGAGQTVTGIISFMVGVASFVLLALWMTRIRSNLAAQGVKAGGPPAVEWWGWFVPIANFVLPLLGMRAITRKSVSFFLLAAWWIPFALYWIVSGFAQTAVFGAVDFSTGELTNPDALDNIVPATWIAAVLMFISWLFLVLIIIRTTERHQKV